MDEQQQPTLPKLRTETVYVKPEKGEDANILCRVCLQEGNIPIYGNNDCFHDVSQDLNVCAGINVRRDDPHPKHLCVNCNSLLQSAIQLRVIAQQSEQLLELYSDTDETANEDFEKKHEEINMDVVIPAKIGTHQHIGHTSEVQDNDQQSYVADDSKPLSFILSSSKNTLYLNPIAKSDSDAKQKSISSKYIRCSKNKEVCDNDQDSTNDTEHFKPQSSKQLSLKILKKTIPKSHSNIKQRSNSSRDIQKRKDTDTYCCKRCHINVRKTEYRTHLLSEEHKNFKETCPLCNNQYDPAYFKTHMKRHKADIRHICDVCGKKFTMKGQFVLHRRTHSLEFPAQCSLCPYRGRDNHRLKKHMQTHSDEKPHQCPHCPKRCNSNNNLRKHILTHKPERDFKCDSCQRGFYRQTDLDRHLKVIHLGIKEHFCELCGKAFGYRKQMMKHSLKVHKREKCKSGRQAFYLLAEQQETNAQDTTS